MEISSIYAWKDKPPRNNAFYLPSSMRAVIVGSSSCGKTVLLLNLLLSDSLDYNRLYIYARSLFQEQYRLIIKGFQKGFSKSQLRILFENQMSLDKMLEFIRNYDGLLSHEIEVQCSEKLSDIPDPADFDTSYNHLVIFDDVMNDSQTNILKYYTRGRLSNIDSIYLAQSFFHLDRRCIRQNSNLFLLFEQAFKNLQHIYSDLAETHMSLEQFRTFTTKVWSEKYNFLTIDLTKPSRAGRYRRNLNEYFLPNQMSFQRVNTVEEEMALQQEIGTKRKMSEDVPIAKHARIEGGESIPATAYQTATNMISKGNRDDGQLGLSTNGKFCTYSYSVCGNILSVSTENGVQNFEINDVKTWIILLAKNPKSMITLETDDPAVTRYRNIIKTLKIVKKHPRRKKSPLAFGDGVHTLAIPSSNEQLLKLLFLKLSEFNAGNDALKQEVVPLAAEAQRRNILPKGLIDPRDMTWVFA